MKRAFIIFIGIWFLLGFLYSVLTFKEFRATEDVHFEREASCSLYADAQPDDWDALNDDFFVSTCSAINPDSVYHDELRVVLAAHDKFYKSVIFLNILLVLVVLWAIILYFYRKFKN